MENSSLGPPPPTCDECNDVAAHLYCIQCKDHYCEPCYFYIHKSGKRVEHTIQQVAGHTKDNLPDIDDNIHIDKYTKNSPTAIVKTNELLQTKANTVRNDLNLNGTLKSTIDTLKEGSASVYFSEHNDSPYSISQYAMYIPLRLNEEERILLEICEGALEISEYTDNVDVSTAFGGFGSGHYNSSVTRKEKVVKQEILELFQICLGLLVCCDAKRARKLIVGRSGGSSRLFEERLKFFGKLAELGRRNKILNPTRMRDTYGKLICILQDMKTIYPSALFILPIRTIMEVLHEDNDDMESGEENTAIDKTHVLMDIDFLHCCKLKMTTLDKHFDADYLTARKRLTSKFSDILTEKALDLLINSCKDYNAHKLYNMSCVEKMLHKLSQSIAIYDAKASSALSLEIKSGRNGSMLSHSHHQQINFVGQSLKLWLNIQRDLNKLWIATDIDLLNTPYRLMNTGQGLQRVQSAQNIGRIMHQILNTTKQSVGSSWVGLSVVHLGDRDVPNGLFFIDKYNQITHILTPIIRCIERLAETGPILDPTKSIHTKIESSILTDYFRHGFDGSGDDGGSCIDGRLTSSWNWCSKIDKKEYYLYFLLTDFIGFNGDFK